MMLYRYSLALLLTTNILCAATLSPIKVTANRPLPSPFSEEVSIDEKEIEQPHSLGDVFEEQSGVNIKQNGALGSNTSVFVRGGNSEHTRVMVDGMRVNDPTTNTYDAGGFLPQSYDKVALLKGPQSQMGSDAMAGALSFDLNKGQGSPKHTLQTSWGSFDTKALSYHGRGSYKRVHANIRTSGQKTQGIVVKPVGLRTTPRDSLSDNSTQFGFHSRIDADITDRTTITLFNRVEDNVNFNSDVFQTNPFRRTQGHKSQHVLRFDHHHDVGSGDVNHSFLIGRYATTNKFGAASNPTGGGTKNFGRRDLLAYRPIFSRGGTSVDTAFEYEEDRMDAFNIDPIPFKTAAGKARTASAMIAPKHRFTLPHNQAITTFGSLRHDRHSMFGETHNYNYGATYELPTKTELTAYVSTAYKAPSLYSLFVNDAYTQANPQLKPERTRSVQYKIAQPLPGGFRVEVTYFKNRLRNLITGQPLTLIKWTSVNLNRTTISGFESCIRWARGAWQTTASHTYLYTQDPTTQQALRRRPKNTIALGLHYRVEEWTIGAHARYQTRPLDVDPITSKNVRGKPVKTVDAYGAYQINKQTEAQIRVENMFGYTNEDPLGFRKSGFAIYGGVKVEV